MSRLLPLEPSDKVALRFGPPGRTVELTYRELIGAAGALVPRIVGCARVAVHATPTIHTAVGVVAGLLAGVPVVPLNPRLGEREVAHELADAAPERVLAAPGAELPFDLPRIDVDIDPARDGDGPSRPSRPQSDPALVIYTSGTTGMPKGAVLSRQAVAANLDGLAAAWAWTSDDLLAHALPLFHVHGLVLGVLGPLRRGGTLHHLGTLDAARARGRGAPRSSSACPPSTTASPTSSRATRIPPPRSAAPACSCPARRRSPRSTTSASASSPAWPSASATA